MKLKKEILAFLPCFLVACAGGNPQLVTSDDPGTALIRIYKDNDSPSKQRYIPPKNVKLKYNYSDLSGTLSNNENVCPSLGEVNLLVIPVHVPGDNTYRTEKTRNDIEKVFFGEKDDSMGFYSLREFFETSSFGKLHFQGKVTDWFDLDQHTSIQNPSQITAGNTGTILNEILRKATSWAKDTQGIDLKDYDKNEDGSIDAIWMVYDHLDWTTEWQQRLKEDPSDRGEDLNSAFWNFTSWDWGTEPNFIEGQDPTTSGFSWASFDMMYTPYAPRDEQDLVDISDLSSIPLDSHTFIHETGHLLGLDDYYTSDNTYHPAGHFTMMDQNVCDFDSYSKMLLGWVTPYVVYGTSEILLQTASEHEHGVIVIPTNYAEISTQIEQAIKSETIEDFVYEFNPFDEYLMIDLYSPDGLNEIDTYGPFLDGRESGISKTGVRLYHIDSRIFKCKVINYDGGQKFSYTEGYVWDGKRLANDEAILMPISNEKTESSSFQLPKSFDYYDQIRLLEAGQMNTFDLGGKANNQTVWTPDSQPFDIATFGYQFFQGTHTFHNGADLPFKMKVLTLKEVE